MSNNFKGVLKQANNEHTGDAVRSGKGSLEKYSEGWDAIFGNKRVEPSPELDAVFKPIHDNKEMFSVENVTARLSAAQQRLLDEPSDVKLYGGCLGGGKSWIADRAKTYAEATYDEFQQRAEKVRLRFPEYFKEGNFEEDVWGRIDD